VQLCGVILLDSFSDLSVHVLLLFEGLWLSLVVLLDEVPELLLSIYGHMSPKDKLRLLSSANFSLVLQEGEFVFD